MWHIMTWYDPQLRMAELNKQSLRLDSARRTHYKVIFRCSRMVTRCWGATSSACQLLLCLQRAVLPSAMRCSGEPEG
jgi:hypothetical protein